MEKISVVISGPQYKEFDLRYSVKTLRRELPDAEIILSTNDKALLASFKNTDYFDKIIECSNVGELPSLKHETYYSMNNNINKQINSSYLGILASSNDIVLKLRTDQLILDDSIFTLWKIIEKLPNRNTQNVGRILTSSIFSINPRFSERMPFHISDMLQLGYRTDLLRYYSAPEYPFEYAIWYENHPYAKYSNMNERLFRSKYAVEQWLSLHYIFGNEAMFPIKFHNDISPQKILQFEKIFTDFFFIAHPDDINLRASKFDNFKSYVNNQCYSTYDSFSLIEISNNIEIREKSSYDTKGINKKYFKYLQFFFQISIVRLIIRNMPLKLKTKIKKMLS